MHLCPISLLFSSTAWYHPNTAQLGQGMIMMTDPAPHIAWPTIDAAFLERLLLTLSHRLRTPLTVALGEATTLRRAYRRLKPSQRDEMLDAIVAACQRLERTIHHLQLTAQVLQHQVAFHREPLDLHALTYEALQTLSATHGAEPLQVVQVVVPASGQERVSADARLLGAVLVHLVDNALLYALPGTPIIITLAADAEQVMWEVRDEGPGIPAEQVRHLPQPFMAVPTDLTQPVTGLGLGLTFCQAVLAAHGSALDITSDVGQGTRCGFRLPHAPASSRRGAG